MRTPVARLTAQGLLPTCARLAASLACLAMFGLAVWARPSLGTCGSLGAIVALVTLLWAEMVSLRHPRSEVGCAACGYRATPAVRVGQLWRCPECGVEAPLGAPQALSAEVEVLGALVVVVQLLLVEGLLCFSCVRLLV